MIFYFSVLAITKLNKFLGISTPIPTKILKITRAKEIMAIEDNDDEI